MTQPDPEGYDPRDHLCPPLSDGAAKVRADNLAHAKRVVLGGHPMADALLNAVGYPALPCTHDWPYSAQLPHVNPEDCE